jgi:hypothetical protein
LFLNEVEMIARLLFASGFAFLVIVVIRANILKINCLVQCS